MEILERGGMSYILRCPHCASRLKCEPEDIKNTGLYKFYTCPVCGNKNYVIDYELERAKFFELEDKTGK